MSRKLGRMLGVTLAVFPVLASTTSAETSDQLQEVTVTGIRASVQAAQDIKRNAPDVVEAITSEDLGKFTDTNIADALQRVPGINIERTDGTFDSGYGVTIRGLGAGFSTSTLNGRELLGIPGFGGSGGRQFDFSTVPPEILSGVTIYKTSTASLVEPGLSGQVNMQTLRPLDYHGSGDKRYFGSLTAGDSYASGSGKQSPRFGATLGLKLLDNTLGFYVAGLYADDRTAKNIAHAYDGTQTFSLDNGKTYTNVLTTQFGYDLWRAHEERSKSSFASGLQWKPSSAFEVNLDYLFNRSSIKRRDQADYWFPSIGSGGFGSAVIPASAVSVGGTGPGLNGWDATRIPGLNGYSISYLGSLKLDYINTAQNGGMNVVWKSDDDKKRLSFDYSDSATDYTISWLHPYLDNGLNSTNRETVNAGGDFPIISETNVGTGPSHSSAAGYNEISFAENFQKRNRANRQAVRLDFDAQLNEALLFKTGVRYADTDSKFVSMDENAAAVPTSVAGAFFPGQLQQLPFLTFQTPVVSLPGFCAANPNFCTPNNFGKGSLVGTFPTSSNGKPGDVLGFDPSQSYEIHETNTAPYVQLDFKEPLFGIKSSGNIGVRGVRIKEQGFAFQGGCTKAGFDSGPCVPGTVRDNLVADHNAYWNVLPSFNLNMMPRDNINLRAAVGKSITLADYNQLAPLGTADIILPVGGTTVGGNVATTGNTHLKPTQAWNYDLTGEYYTSYGGSYIASVFYKDVKDLIVTVTEYGATVPGQGSTLFDSTTAVNLSSGHTDGLELNTNQPLTFLPSPWDGFGMQANYTYVQSKTRISGEATQFPGSSKQNANVAGYFEKWGFAARIAVSYRSSYLVALGTPGDGGNGNQIARAETRLDASISQKITSHLEVIATGSNLTSQAVSDYSPSGGMVASYFTLPATYSIAVRGSF